MVAIKRHPMLANYALMFAISSGGMLLSVDPSGIFKTKSVLAVMLMHASLAAGMLILLPPAISGNVWFSLTALALPHCGASLRRSLWP